MGQALAKHRRSRAASSHEHEDIWEAAFDGEHRGDEASRLERMRKALKGGYEAARLKKMRRELKTGTVDKKRAVKKQMVKARASAGKSLA